MPLARGYQQGPASNEHTLVLLHTVAAIFNDQYISETIAQPFSLIVKYDLAGHAKKSAAAKLLNSPDSCGAKLCRG